MTIRAVFFDPDELQEADYLAASCNEFIAILLRQER